MSKVELGNDCIANDFSSAWYDRWFKEMKPMLNFTRHDNKKLPANQKHNKIWQTSIIAERLDRKGLLKAGKKGIGFGVGTEMLPSIFAKYGVDVLATDQGSLKEDGSMWDGGSQLANELEDCFFESIVSKKVFSKQVKFEAVDMNDLSVIPKSKYDFLWSNCAMGHIGGTAKTKAFVVNSLNLLKPGGWAVHTTELNVSSLINSIPDNPAIVIWNLSSLEDLFEEISKQGHYVDDFFIRLNNSKEDLVVDRAPYCKNEYHMKLELAGFIGCQINFNIKKDGGRNPRLAKNNLLNRRTMEDYWRAMGKKLSVYTTDTTVFEAPVKGVPEIQKTANTLLPEDMFTSRNLIGALKRKTASKAKKFFR